MSTSNQSPVPAVFPVVATSAQTQALQAAKSAGYTQGHVAGYAAGLQLAREEALAARSRADAEHAAVVSTAQAHHRAELAALRLAATALTQRTAPVLADAEAALFSHALELAEALLGQELSSGERSARTALARACGERGNEVPVTISMNAADVACLVGVALPAGVELTADPAINRGDAIAQYPHGFLDAGLASAVRRVKTALLGDSLPVSALSGAPAAGEAGHG